MYFILSKVLLFLLVPFYWFLLLLALAAFNRNKSRQRRFFIIAVSVLYLFSIPAPFKGFTKLWDVKPTPQKNLPKHSCVIVLGGFSGAGGEDGGRFNWAADRFITGVQLLKTGKAQHILISGGNGSLSPGNFREALWVNLQLKKIGIADSLILIESNSRNTLENAAFSKQLLIKHNLKPPYVLVTSAFHMRRAKMIFDKNGIAVAPYSCTYLTDNTHLYFSDFIPQADILANWELYLKEVVGYIVNYFQVKRG